MTDRLPHLAFVFPGQGSQSLGMLADMAAAHHEVTATFDQASKVLGFDLWNLVQSGPEAELNRTENTQPALLTAGVALWRVWESRKGPRPAWLAGHSLGEYTALVCAGALDFEAAVALVAERGRLMQEAVPVGAGAMAAVLGLDDQAVGEVCQSAAQGEVVEPVNFNAPGQVVIAGHRQAVERAMAGAKERGASRVLSLPVSVPSHCALMKPAAERLGRRLAEVEIRPPAIPVLHNVDVTSHGKPEAIRQALVAQLYNPVRWVEIIQTLANRGVALGVECGPGKVLAGLNKRIDRKFRTVSLNDAASLEAALAASRE
ncbi:MAG: ACP S-malonyltransferase [Candidatus Competibacteraceae bacterium]|nr:ACP S-malonyltransferase [Candidatus Competibacteraceae bacterium]